MLVLTVVLTAVVALALGLAPAKVARRCVRQLSLIYIPQPTRYLRLS